MPQSAQVPKWNTTTLFLFCYGYRRMRLSRVIIEDKVSRLIQPDWFKAWHKVYRSINHSILTRISRCRRMPAVTFALRYQDLEANMHERLRRSLRKKFQQRIRKRTSKTTFFIACLSTRSARTSSVPPRRLTGHFHKLQIMEGAVINV